MTHSADEALRVPERVESRDVVLQDGAGAAATFRREHVKVVLPAECLPILLVETYRAEKSHTDSLSMHASFSNEKLSTTLRLFVLVTDKQMIPSGPKKAPHWAQKKCSGCQVLSKAVTTFCETKVKQMVKHSPSHFSGHSQQSNMFARSENISECEARRGQAKSTEAVWEVQEYYEC